MRLFFRKRNDVMWRAHINSTESAWVAHLGDGFHAFILIRTNPGLRKHIIGIYPTKLDATRAASTYAQGRTA